MNRQDESADVALELHAQPLLPDVACAGLIEAHAAMNWSAGTVGKSGEVLTLADFDIRRCQVTALSADGVLARIETMANALFQSRPDMKLEFHPSDPAIILCYHVGDFFDWHVDTGRGGLVAGGRVVSFSIQLSDPAEYLGGDLEFRTDLDARQRAYLRSRGHIVFFPSRAAHRVTAVRDGVRYVAVGWLHIRA